ncbi:MAG: FHA domain-containing protein, partial [Acidobacteriota bacterium]|nr:FHA domain-containing protein [Acidobacteriota bacterium]MDX2467912.1 FHA domain-containing protein [Acidimicrobiia bacterium]
MAPGDTALVGRDAACALTIDSPLVSRRHVEVSWTNGGWYLRDLDSSNGTFRNGVSVTEVAVGTAIEVRLGHPTEGPTLVLSTAAPQLPAGVITIGRDPTNT